MASLTLEQLRASYALEAVRGLAVVDDPALLEVYVREIKGFPATVLTNGLGQALALLLAKGGDGEKALYGHIEAWLCDKGRCPFPPYPGVRMGASEPAVYPLMEAMMKGSQAQYVQAQAEVHALVGWLKKFALAAKGGE